MRIPKKHWGCSLSQIPEKCSHKEPILKWVQDVHQNVRSARGLLLLGDYSTGKSGTAAICLKAAADRGLIGFWTTARDLPGQVIKDVLFDEDMTIIERAESVPLLVIDEVQVRDTVAFSEQVVEMLVRHRIDNQLGTILTTNHSREQLQTKYPALIAALTEAVFPVYVSGHNFREQIAKEWQ